jgi:hypothetical protein
LNKLLLLLTIFITNNIVSLGVNILSFGRECIVASWDPCAVNEEHLHLY